MTAMKGGTHATWRALPAGIREALATSFDACVRRNPLNPGVKKHVLAKVLGGDARLDKVLRWIGIAGDDPSIAELRRTLSFEEKVLMHLFQEGSEYDAEALRRATGHRFEAWTDLMAFTQQAHTIAAGYGSYT